MTRTVSNGFPLRSTQEIRRALKNAPPRNVDKLCGEFAALLTPNGSGPDMDAAISLITEQFDQHGSRHGGSDVADSWALSAAIIAAFNDEQTAAIVEKEHAKLADTPGSLLRPQAAMRLLVNAFARAQSGEQELNDGLPLLSGRDYVPNDSLLGLRILTDPKDGSAQPIYTTMRGNGWPPQHCVIALGTVAGAGLRAEELCAGNTRAGIGVQDGPIRVIAIGCDPTMINTDEDVAGYLTALQVKREIAAARRTSPGVRLTLVADPPFHKLAHDARQGLPLKSKPSLVLASSYAKPLRPNTDVPPAIADAARVPQTPGRNRDLVTIGQ